MSTWPRTKTRNKI